MFDVYTHYYRFPESIWDMKHGEGWVRQVYMTFPLFVYFMHLLQATDIYKLKHVEVRQYLTYFLISHTKQVSLNSNASNLNLGSAWFELGQGHWLS